jgi:hypothetical protein
MVLYFGKAGREREINKERERERCTLHDTMQQRTTEALKNQFL